MIIIWKKSENGKAHRISETDMDSIPSGAFLYMPNGKYLGRKSMDKKTHYSSEMIF